MEVYMNNVTDRILAKLSKKNAAIGYRTDIAIAEFKPISTSAGTEPK